MLTRLKKFQTKYYWFDLIIIFLTGISSSLILILFDVLVNKALKQTFVATIWNNWFFELIVIVVLGMAMLKAVTKYLLYVYALNDIEVPEGEAEINYQEAFKQKFLKN